MMSSPEWGFGKDQRGSSRRGRGEFQQAMTARHKVPTVICSVSSGSERSSCRHRSGVARYEAGVWGGGGSTGWRAGFRGEVGNYHCPLAVSASSSHLLSF